MSDLGGPHGWSLGILECIAKTKNSDGRVTVFFRSDDSKSSAVFTLEAEEADHYFISQAYEFRATTP